LPAPPPGRPGRWPGHQTESPGSRVPSPPSGTDGTPSPDGGSHDRECIRLWRRPRAGCWSPERREGRARDRPAWRREWSGRRGRRVPPRSPPPDNRLPAPPPGGSGAGGRPRPPPPRGIQEGETDRAVPLEGDRLQSLERKGEAARGEDGAPAPAFEGERQRPVPADAIRRRREGWRGSSR